MPVEVAVVCACWSLVEAAAAAVSQRVVGASEQVQAQ